MSVEASRRSLARQESPLLATHISRICLTSVLCTRRLMSQVTRGLGEQTRKRTLPDSPAPSIKHLTVFLCSRPLLYQYVVVATRSHSDLSYSNSGDARLFCPRTLQLLVNGPAVLVLCRRVRIDRLSAAHVVRRPRSKVRCAVRGLAVATEGEGGAESASDRARRRECSRPFVSCAQYPERIRTRVRVCMRERSERSAPCKGRSETSEVGAGSRAGHGLASAPRVYAS